VGGVGGPEVQNL